MLQPAQIVVRTNEPKPEPRAIVYEMLHTCMITIRDTFEWKNDKLINNKRWWKEAHEALDEIKPVDPRGDKVTHLTQNGRNFKPNEFRGDKPYAPDKQHIFCCCNYHPNSY